MTGAVLPACQASVPEDATPVYLGLLVPTGISGVTATLGEANDAVHRAMDQHGHACAAGIFQAHPAHDRPYVRLVPKAEWMAANPARARLRDLRQNTRRREITTPDTMPRHPGRTSDGLETEQYALPEKHDTAEADQPESAERPDDAA